MKKYLRSSIKDKYVISALLAILLLAATLRLYGLNWDQNQHLHPDERFLTMVTQATSWPHSLSEYLNPDKSPLNPHNAGFGFFVYGTLPLKVVKLFSEFIKFDPYNYNNIALVGRFISAIFDLGVVFLVYKISRIVFNKKTALLSAFLYSISVLPIQLSHFFAVDTFLVFFLTFSFYLIILLIKQRKISLNNILLSILLGISFGFALASKISAILFLSIIVIGYVFLFIGSISSRKKTFVYLFTCLLGCIFAFTLSSFITLRTSDPHIFEGSSLTTPSTQFIQNIKQLKSFDNPESLFPPAVQWIKTKPLIFPLKNIIFWGLGLPLGVVTVLAVIYSSFRILKKLKWINKLTDQQIIVALILLWIFGLFIYQGIQFAKNMRYFYPIYPFLAILSANFLYLVNKKINRHYKKGVVPWFLGSLVLLSILIWPLSFIQIYSRPHSRVTASKWIYKNIPPGSTLSCEHWDDCLPLFVNSRDSRTYHTETLTFYDPDTEAKWLTINAQLNKIDYLILSSNRLWGSISQVPRRYPIAAMFYSDLFSNKLQFVKVAEFTSYPTLPLLNIEILDESADESFTVYDHPKVIIFKHFNKPTK
jgi:4-amino-4-deoxy-L-arabinose transferase-like glycosyltransferase